MSLTAIFCVVGVGTNSSLLQAQLASLNSAIEQAAEYLANQAGGGTIKSEALRDFVERAASISTVVESRDRGGQYQYLTVLRLNPKFADPKVVHAFASEPRAVHAGAPVMVRAARDPFGGPGSYWGVERGRLTLASRVEHATAFVFDKSDAARRVGIQIRHGDPITISTFPDGTPVSLVGMSLVATPRGQKTEFILETESRVEGGTVREGDGFVIRTTGREPTYLSGTRSFQFQRGSSSAGQFVVVVAPRLHRQ